jgi:hypothetical protein
MIGFPPTDPRERLIRMRIVAAVALVAVSLSTLAACGTDTTQINESQGNELLAKTKVWGAKVSAAGKAINECSDIDSQPALGNCLGTAMDDFGEATGSLAPYLRRLSSELTGPCATQIKAAAGQFDDFKDLTHSIGANVRSGDAQAFSTSVHKKYNRTINDAQKSMDKALDTCTSGS